MHESAFLTIVLEMDKNNVLRTFIHFTATYFNDLEAFVALPLKCIGVIYLNSCLEDSVQFSEIILTLV